MPMLVIKGSFHVKGGAKPDGDTIPFTPDHPTDWKLVPGLRKVVPKADGHANVRLEAIDALETHYSGQGPEVHQPLPFAHAAADELLNWLGFTDVHRNPDETVTATPDSVPGFILTRGADIHNRCVALVGRGAPPAASGYEINVGVPLLRKTANHHLLTLGLAFPTYYAGLPSTLRDELTVAVDQAQAAPAKGLWPSDVTMTGAKVTGMSSITDEVVILPKLFRRLKDYLDLGNPSLACFPSFLAGAADTFRILSTDTFRTGLHHVVEISNGNTVRMTHPAEDLLFDEA
ncbi:nuclease [Streptomyces coffeae]|uniref:Nuclease n=1 Tax=Streptomyces coffeae TaxID=621382 RepID=A0ABS1NC84_9ACTN|nr:nuclease [Streptomyces coffeae]MBL1097677.1 nuclease [Streptomyces coffeae]